MIKRDGDKKTIVLVEDEKTIANLIKVYLEEIGGYEVIVAEDGLRGLKIIQEQKPDLVLLDIMLPILNGFDVLEALNKEKILPSLPVIIISASGQPVEIDRAVRLGVRDYLIKVNFNPREILTKVDAIFQYERDEPKSKKKSSPASILIVEDDVILVEMIKQALEQKYTNIQTASGAKDATQILQNNKIDCVLLDIILPDKDGFTFLEELKANPKFKDIPVMIISNLGQAVEIERARVIGAVDYLVKAEVTPKEISEKVDLILNLNQ